MHGSGVRQVDLPSEAASNHQKSIEEFRGGDRHRVEPVLVPGWPVVGAEEGLDQQITEHEQGHESQGSKRKEPDLEDVGDVFAVQQKQSDL